MDSGWGSDDLLREADRLGNAAGTNPWRSLMRVLVFRLERLTLPDAVARVDDARKLTP
ncbi:hypothetical protein GXB85_02120 [Cellulomonas sp. APG4]|uniref:hypothetical protein n=1 Tax=Cellulomonas sp. APG4 TaxID=1538656 RepID=UPI00137944E6|nr:hypothetical protein [Cellulomonas sp. APG4]NCT89753.1 hypothetical protein [Cellulomonas sp. APG4]